MAIYKPSLLDKFKDFVNGLRSNWDIFESHLAESSSKHITESGTNSNGSYIKFDDGTLICRVSNFRLNNFVTNRLRRTWTYPEPFIDPPTVTVTLLGSNRTIIGDMAGRIITNVDSKTNVSCLPHVWNTAFSEGDYVDVDIMAIGRWK